MISTYVIEDSTESAVEYFRTLSDAKRFVVRNFDKGFSILSLRGQNFGEGFHRFRYRLKNNVTFSREKLQG